VHDEEAGQAHRKRAVDDDGDEVHGSAVGVGFLKRGGRRATGRVHVHATGQQQRQAAGSEAVA
jgi:hypothetical protein